MRFIRQNDVQPRLPNDWEEQVGKAKKAIVKNVRQAAKAARQNGKSGVEFRAEVCKAAHKAIAQSGDVWRNAKEALADVSRDKCWYCECKQERSDLHVDHFRPKGRASGEKSHFGYWWLAFDWKNFRLACTFCNCVRDDAETDESGGKGTKFPIILPPERMHRLSDPQDRAALLDPVISDDVEKITFTANGLPKPVANDENSEDWQRVDQTIEVYHLRETRLKRAREDLAIKIEEDFVIANTAHENGDLKTFTTVADRLIGRIRADAKYTTFARLILGSHRDIQWVEKLWKHL